MAESIAGIWFDVKLRVVVLAVLGCCVRFAVVIDPDQFPAGLTSAGREIVVRIGA